MESPTVVPRLLDSESLRQLLRPDLKGPRVVVEEVDGKQHKRTVPAQAWRNWIARATADLGFPKPIRVGQRRTMWVSDEVTAWLQSRPRGGRFDGRRRGQAAA